ncbi:uncharacterized protein LOC112573363 isoform X2 [Pomacea canaliculata]|uniref:uncharacterized protein LOC112573363 isoform X2 n=1 Tax=Pomacea canaliculata TaxID=400727 RepID=UPI000D72F4C5|nr:uncharacterized protein LOC112573363 isoform X2 [Pomacea canaliculata]
MSETCPSFVNSPEVNASCEDLFSQVTPNPETAGEMLPSLNSGIISQSARPNMTKDNQDRLETSVEPAHSELEPGRKVSVPSDKDCDSNKSMPHTHFLESLISSLNINKSSTEEEVIKLPRSQLAMIVRQTLYMQTLYNFMQGLVQEKWPKQRNFMFKEEMNEAKNPLLMQIQDTVSERQIFRFDNPLTDLSDQSKPIIIQNADVSHNTADSSYKVGTFETDGESTTSMSLQLPSQLNLDGDHPESENPLGKGENNKVTLSGNTEIATSPEQQFNIPDLDLIEGSQECFQHSSNGPRDYVDNVGISFEEFELMQDELCKSKRYMHVLLHENKHLKETVRTLEEANTALKERESRFIGANMEQVKPHEHHLAVLVEKVKKMEKNIELKDHAMAILNTKIAIVQNENKILKDQVHSGSLVNKAGPQSQPPSDTGYSALPPIMEPCIRCVTQETQTSLQQDEKNVPMLLAELENVRAENKNMQKQIDHLKHTHSQISYGEVEQKKALEKQLKSIKEELLQYQKKLKESEDHRRELADEITGSYDEIDKEKKKSLIAEERYRRLEGIMEDERRRFTRDEKLLLERCDQLDKSVHL